MFHSGRALLYSKGYREKSHSALLEALTALFVRTGLLERDYIDDLRDAKSMRESVDYGMIFSEEGARTLIINADKFLRKVAKSLEP
jgi:uncharacterized protein (UPF0332 family)